MTILLFLFPKWWSKSIGYYSKFIQQDVISCKLTRTDRQTERWTDGGKERQKGRTTDWTIHRYAWSQLKLSADGMKYHTLRCYSGFINIFHYNANQYFINHVLKWMWKRNAEQLSAKNYQIYQPNLYHAYCVIHHEVTVWLEKTSDTDQHSITPISGHACLHLWCHVKEWHITMVINRIIVNTQLL